MATHRDLKAVEEFLTNKTYPKGILKDKGKKSNITKACKNVFSIVNGDLMYKEKRRVVFEVERRSTIIQNVHKDIGDNSMVKALAAYHGRESTYQKISERFFWQGTIEDIKEYIKICKSCQQCDASRCEFESTGFLSHTSVTKKLESNHHVNKKKLNVTSSVNQMVIREGGESHRLAVW